MNGGWIYPPSTLSRTAPPGHKKSDFDIVNGPLRAVDVDAGRQLYETLDLTNGILLNVQKIAFATNASVAYLTSYHTRVLL